MLYPIETRLASKNGWDTPDEARRRYGKYSRGGITCHWWNTPDKAGTHDETVEYILGQASAGNMSVNYVVSDKKITLLVAPDNVAWHATAGNPTTIGIEFDPRLGAEGYKRGGWLIAQLEKRYGKTLKLYRHSDWDETECPGTINIAKLSQEADKAKRATGAKTMTYTQAQAKDWHDRVNAMKPHVLALVKLVAAKDPKLRKQIVEALGGKLK
jgi:N-acetylmuramoyl-L-alanine amidase CwlA